VKLSDLADKGFSPLDYRYHCFTAHYRKQLDFTWESLESSKTSRRRLAEAARALGGVLAKPGCAEHSARLREALGDDLNMPSALAAVWDALKSDVPAGAKRTFLEEADSVLGLDLFKAEEAASLPPEVASLVELRAAARASKNFAESDRLRAAIEALGWLVEDAKGGQKARRK